jgi:hypothetical protein
MAHPVQDLPAELAERLQRLADTQTAGSSPWPGVDVAVRRSHRRRLAGVSTVAAASLLAGVAAFGGLLTPSQNDSKPVSPPVTQLPTPVVKHAVTPEEAGLTGATGGSLGEDSAWLNGLRDRVIELARHDRKVTVSRKQIFVLWAGDLNGGRYAVVNYRETETTKRKRSSWVDGIMQGPAGASAGAMELPFSGIGRNLSTTANSEFLPARSPGAPAAGLLFVTAPKASKVEVATARRFGPDGKVSTDWRPLTKQGGAVWATELTAAERYLFDTRVTGMIGGGGSGASVDTVTAAFAVALPGTNRAALERASYLAHDLGASLAEKPVLATSISLGGSNMLAATVLRSPDGGYLFGLAEQYHPHPGSQYGAEQSTSMISDHTFTSPESMMVAVKVPGDKGVTPKHPKDHYLVIAPAGAEQVMLRGITVKVRNRLAVIDAPAPPYSYSADTPEAPAQIQALDGADQVIGTVTAIEGDETGSDSGKVPGKPKVDGSYFEN